MHLTNVSVAAADLWESKKNLHISEQCFPQLCSFWDLLCLNLFLRQQLIKVFLNPGISLGEKSTSNVS